jgi:hypothetical protein
MQRVHALVLKPLNLIVVWIEFLYLSIASAVFLIFLHPILDP